MKISRQAYVDMYCPTTGDKVRLGDTELWIEIEKTTHTTVKKSCLVEVKLFATVWVRASVVMTQ